MEIKQEKSQKTKAKRKTKIKKPEETAPKSPDDDEIIHFNIGGEIFQTRKETIRRNRSTALSDEEFLKRNYMPNAGGYFFDRDPDMFRAVLNYLRTGKLHLPSYVCGPAVKAELTFWGVPPSKIERCCWAYYNDWNSTLKALNRFEKDSKSLPVHKNTVEEDEYLTCWEKWRPVIWRFLTRSNSSTGAKVLGIVSLFVVFLSIFTFVAETTEPFKHFTTFPNSSYQPSNTSSHGPNNNGSVEDNNATVDNELYKYVKIEAKHPALAVIDYVCLVFFTVEYIARLACAPRKLKFFATFLAIVDLLAILPDYVELFVYALNPEYLQDVRVVSYISILRVARILRIFRLIRHVPGLWIFVYTLRASFSELMLLFWFMIMGILLFSSLIFFVDDREVFKDIPEGFWWALITMTTVGYGDMYPTTSWGKVIGSFCAICGVLMIGFTVPALVNNFMLYYRDVQFAVQIEKQQKEEKKDFDEKNKNRKDMNTVLDANSNPLDDKDKNAKKESESLRLGDHVFHTKLGIPNGKAQIMEEVESLTSANNVDYLKSDLTVGRNQNMEKECESFDMTDTIHQSYL